MIQWQQMDYSVAKRITITNVDDSNKWFSGQQMDYSVAESITITNVNDSYSSSYILKVGRNISYSMRHLDPKNNSHLGG